jgi:hypothetical protein
LVQYSRVAGLLCRPSDPGTFAFFAAAPSGSEIVRRLRGTPDSQSAKLDSRRAGIIPGHPKPEKDETRLRGGLAAFKAASRARAVRRSAGLERAGHRKTPAAVPGSLCHWSICSPCRSVPAQRPRGAVKVRPPAHTPSRLIDNCEMGSCTSQRQERLD